MEIPVSGPFSASGPFVFGPIWYWFHALFTLLNPSSVMWLWIVQTSISTLMPLVMFIVGRKIINSHFGLLLGFFTAISTAQIAQATNLTYSSFAGFFSVFILLFFVFFIKSKKTIYIFLMSLFMGLAMNIHFQAVGYFLFLPIIILLNLKSPKNIFFIILGFFIPFIPLIFFDFTSNHYQSRNIVEYLLNGGSANSLPKRWLIYVGEFWPKAYSHIIGGYSPIGILIGTISFLVVLYSFFKKKINLTILFIGIFFILNFIVLRYFKGNIFDAFLVYLHPSILIITAWVVYTIFKWNKYAGIMLFLIISSFTFIKNYEEISNATNHTAVYSLSFMNKIRTIYPNEKFAVYDYEFETSNRSYPIVMYMMKNDLLNDEGRKIGFLQATISAELEIHNAPLILGTLNENILLDLNRYTREELEEKGWVFINPSGVYESVIKWYEKEN